MAEKNRLLKSAGGAVILAVCSFFSFTVYRSHQFAVIDSALPLTSSQQSDLQKILYSKYPEAFSIIKELPYNLGETGRNIYAESAILIDVANGCILYSKNADEVIPPASMTKLFAMYVVDEEVSAGRLSYNQYIPLPPEVWASHMPPHSSLMFLGEGQKVTLEELLLGLSICSGNDAAYALAYAVCGNMEDFVARMNKAASDLGLTHTYFEESSGYSENNTTTAFEMAQFCREYIRRHPDSLERYHSVRDFTYPKERNLAPGDKIENQDFSRGFPDRITMPIYQKNTNPLLGKLEGCDGLKTGYIDESGYNLALTAARGGRRFLSVTMKGPGATVAEGQSGRVHDGTELMEWAFSNFIDVQLSRESADLNVRIYGAKEKAVRLIPVGDEIITVPFISGSSIYDCMEKVRFSLKLHDESEFTGAVQAGQILGEIAVVLDDMQLAVIKLAADRTVEKANIIVSLSDSLIKKDLVIQ